MTDEDSDEAIQRRIDECRCASGTQECPSHPCPISCEDYL
jgi:hypothetical protein